MKCLKELQLADDFSRKPVEIYIIPPDENHGVATDEDSGEVDATDFNMNKVGTKILYSEKELVDGQNVKMKCQR